MLLRIPLLLFLKIGCNTKRNITAKLQARRRSQADITQAGDVNLMVSEKDADVPVSELDDIAPTPGTCI